MSGIEIEKSGVIKSLRACLISAKDGIPVTHLNRDYQQLLGEHIPFQRLGYKSLEEFLKSIPDISVNLKAGIYYAKAKVSENTASLISLVQGQKRSSKKKTKSARNVIHIKQNRPPRYRRRPSAPAAPLRPAMKNYVPENLPTRTVTFRPEKNNFTIDENKNVSIDLPVTNNKTLLPSPTTEPINRLQQFMNSENPEAKNHINNSTSFSHDTKTSAIPYKHSTSLDNSASSLTSTMNSRLQKHKSTSDLQKSPNKFSTEVVTPAPESKQLSDRLKQAAQSNQINNKLSKEGKPPALNKSVSFTCSTSSISPNQPFPLRQSAQSRLEKTRILPHESKLVVVVDTQEGNKGCLYQSKLSAYVQEKKWPKEPSYVVYKQRSKKRISIVCYACTVRVAIPRQSSRLPEEIFECSTFPHDFRSQAESKEYAASQALERLLQRESLLNAPIVKDTSIILDRIKKFVDNKDSGIWAHKIEDEYNVTYQQLLPEYWVDLIRVAEQFELEELGPSYIIRLKDSALDIHSLQVPTMPTLTFPSPGAWDVFVTAGTSVTNVHLRFIGDEYSARFDLFSTSMDSWYENIKNRVPAQFSLGEYCAAYSSKTWWRVIITSLEGDYARIKFIDHGDEEKIKRSNLYKLDSRFYKLPPQAVSVSLKGLEEFAKRKETEDFFIKTIIGKSLVGVVETFLPSLNQISLSLYDTSNEEEAINLNDTLRHLFELDYKHPPQLEVGSVHEMTVTNVELDGRVFVQVFNDGLALLQELIDFFEEIDFESLTDYNQIKADKVYLALQHDDNLYYRVKPVNTTPVDSKVQVYCIDYGKCCNVFLEDLVHMEDSSYLLEQIPGQAIPISLHDIPPAAFTPTIRDKLRKLVSGDPPPAIVGRVRDTIGGIPIVELFRRTVPDSLLVSINQTLVVEENIQLTSMKLDRLHLSSDRTHMSSVQSTQLSNPGLHSVMQPKETVEIITKILTAFPAGSIERILSQNRPELPDIDDYFNVYVHSTVSPSHFLINPANYVTSLNKVMDEMNNYYNTNLVQTILEEGSLCAAKDGNYWYRAYIDKVIDRENVSVKVIDYGCLKIIPSCNVKPLLDVFTKHPFIGFSAKIHGIVPAHGDWSVEDSITMKNLINKKTVRAKLKDIIPSQQGLGGMILSLELHATDRNGKDYHVAEYFVRQYKAKFE